MTLRTKRTLFARVQFMVFTTMLLLSFAHVHPAVVSSYDTCSECVDHEPHSGHLSLNIIHSHDCVLCQFTTLPYMAAVLTLLGLLPVVGAAVLSVCPSTVLAVVLRTPSLRGPPVC